MKTVGKIALFAIAVGIVGGVRAGHESPVYPSYYPQEIRIEPLDPAAAGRALAEGRIQAYVGAIAELPTGAEATVKFVESLGSYIVVRVNPDLPLAPDARCALATKAVSRLAIERDGFRFHPYPVTPYHADYFHHFDLVAQNKSRFTISPAVGDDVPKMRASGSLAETIVGPQRMALEDAWEIIVEEVGLDELIAESRIGLNGWVGPPWLKEGWFHAYLLLQPGLADADARARAEGHVIMLRRGEHRNDEERINRERNLLKLLTGDCRTIVAGYGLRRWYYSDDYSRGVENIGYDSHFGFRSAIFVRTAKLKDFPWNGWLTLGVPKVPAAAWNPLGGLSDDTGRLIWLTLGDPALFPEPYNAGWNLNRIGEVQKVVR